MHAIWGVPLLLLLLSVSAFAQEPKVIGSYKVAKVECTASVGIQAEPPYDKFPPHKIPVPECAESVTLYLVKVDIDSALSREGQLRAAMMQMGDVGYIQAVYPEVRSLILQEKKLEKFTLAAAGSRIRFNAKTTLVPVFASYTLPEKVELHPNIRANEYIFVVKK